MAWNPGQLFPSQFKSLYNPQDPTLLSSVMRRNLEAGAAAQHILQTTIESLPRRPTLVSLHPEQVQVVRRQLPVLTRQPIWLSVDDVRELQSTLFAAWQAISAARVQDQPTRRALVSWYLYFSGAQASRAR
jgi:hypothetical protein